MYSYHCISLKTSYIFMFCGFHDNCYICSHCGLIWVWTSFSISFSSRWFLDDVLFVICINNWYIWKLLLLYSNQSVSCGLESVQDMSSKPLAVFGIMWSFWIKEHENFQTIKDDTLKNSQWYCKSKRLIAEHRSFSQCFINSIELWSKELVEKSDTCLWI